MREPIALRPDFDAALLRGLARESQDPDQVRRLLALAVKLVVPHNITIVLLPPKCPELNPQENVWQFIRDNWLSNRVFDDLHALIDHCCDAWNKLEAQPWTIMSIGLRHWAHRF